MNTALILQPDFKTGTKPQDSRNADQQLLEACGLAHAIDLEIVHTQIISIAKMRAATLIGPGVVEQIAQIAEELDYPLIILNASLTPVQHRNLERSFKAKVIDRTALILEIFGARAKSHAGRLQVELAAITFQKSRLVRSWTHLERQRGGGGFLGGPGERQLELDKRMLTNQIRQIKGELAEVRRTRTLQRVRRQKSHTPSVALVGYTNAGKSTLFNRLTGADVLSKDMLFATLDPTIRGCKLPSGRTIMISDTVGFISALPTELVEAFKSTLEEVIEADLILHVHDLSAHNFEQEAEDVTRILTEIGLDSLDREDRLIHVFNKCDNLHDEEQQLLAESIRAGVAEPFGHSIVCSAITDEGLDDLFSAMDQFFNRDEKLLCLQLKPEEASAGAWLHQNGQVHISEYDNKGMHLIKVSLSQANLARFMKSWPAIQIVQQEYPK